MDSERFAIDVCDLLDSAHEEAKFCTRENRGLLVNFFKI